LCSTERGSYTAANDFRAHDQQSITHCKNGPPLQSLVCVEHAASGRLRRDPALSVRGARRRVHDRGQLRSLEAVVPDALLFALTMVALNTVVGLCNATLDERWRRPPRASCCRFYSRSLWRAIFTFLPRAAAWDATLELAVIAFVTSSPFALAAHSGMAPMFARRTLVLGTGTEAVAVEQSIGHLGQQYGFSVLPGESRRGPSGGRHQSAGRRHGSRRRGAAVQGRRNHRRRARAPWWRARCASCSTAS
jgi:hypothetical protein